MHVLHLVHQYLPEHVGGTELYTKWVTDCLSQTGVQTSIFYRRQGQPSGLDYRQDGQTHVWAATSPTITPAQRFWATFSDRPLSRLFNQLLDETQPDLIHLNHLMGHPFAVVRALQRRNIPHLITLHDFWWVCANAQLLTNYSQELCDGPQRYLNCARCALARSQRERLWPIMTPVLATLLAYRHRRLHQILRQAEQLIAPTEFVRRWYIAHEVPATNIVTIPHGLPLPDGLPAIRSAARPENRPLRFAYIGGLSWQKGVHGLVEAFQPLSDQAELWIAGDETADPPYTARLRAMASPAVRFLGRLSREQVWQTLGQVDVVVVPALWYETFSFIISEAFAAGVPVIASKLGPLADRVTHEVDGLLVPHGDVLALKAAMHRLLNEPELLPHLRAGVSFPNSIQAYVETLQQVYRRCLRAENTQNFTIDKG